MEVSLACLFQIITGTQQLMTLCGEPLDYSTEVKYQELRAALKKYINENALMDEHKIGPDYDETSLALAREQLRVREGFCKRPEYKVFKADLFQFLKSEQEVDAIRNYANRLAPVEPFESRRSKPSGQRPRKRSA